jgi:IS30 family transposase
MSQRDNDRFEGIERRLDAVIGILLKQTQLQEQPSRSHIALLSSMGFKDTEIATILGKTRGYVSSELVEIRKKKKIE